MAKGDKPPKTALTIGLVLLLLSLGGCGFGCVSFVSVLSDLDTSLSDAESQPSGSLVEVSDAKGWVLNFGTSQDFSCEVVDQNQETVKLNLDVPLADSETTQDGQSLYLLGAFEAKNSNSYEITCETPDQTGDFRVLNVPNLNSALYGIGGVGVGVLFFVIGLILLIVGLVRRGKWKRQHSETGGFPGGPPGGPPAPGGYGGPSNWQGGPGGYQQPPGQGSPGFYPPSQPGAPDAPTGPGAYPPPPPAPGNYPPPPPGPGGPPQPSAFPPPMPPPSGPGNPPTPGQDPPTGPNPPTQQPPPFG